MSSFPNADAVGRYVVRETQRILKEDGIESQGWSLQFTAIAIMTEQSSYKPSNILIFGATGLIGKHIADALFEAKASFNKIGIFTSEGSVKRKAEIFKGFRSKGAEIITGDLQNEQDVLKAYKGLIPLRTQHH